MLLPVSMRISVHLARTGISPTLLNALAFSTFCLAGLLVASEFSDLRLEGLAPQGLAVQRFGDSEQGHRGASIALQLGQVRLFRCPPDHGPACATPS